MCARWKIGPHVVADDAIFAKTGSGAGCIADEFAREGIYFDSAQKGDRVSGWQRMRRLLSDAGKPDHPGLYVSRACRYWWHTSPYAGRDLKRPEEQRCRSHARCHAVWHAAHRMGEGDKRGLVFIGLRGLRSSDMGSAVRTVPLRGGGGAGHVLRARGQPRLLVVLEHVEYKRFDMCRHSLFSNLERVWVSTTVSEC